MDIFITKGGYYEYPTPDDRFSLTNGTTKRNNNVMERIFQLTAQPTLRKF